MMYSLPPAKKIKKLKVKLKQEPYIAHEEKRKRTLLPLALVAKTDRGLRLFPKLPSLSPHLKQLHQGAKCFMKSAKQHLKQTKRLPRTMSLCKAALLFASNQSRFTSPRQIMRGQLSLLFL